MKNVLKKFRKMYHQIAYIIPMNQQFQQRANMLNDSVINSDKMGVTDHKYFEDHQIIVSLTTFGVRLSQVYLTIESIMQQTKQANRIVLWLSKDMEGTILPQTLVNQMRRGLEINYCEDIRSYKKLIPSLKMFPNDAIITIDDDVVYHITTLESLINSYLEDQNYIYFNRGHRAICRDGKFLPYTQWEWETRETDASELNLPTGVGGILYPPRILSNEVFNETVFMSECKYADDIWFYAMTLLNNKRSRLSKLYMTDPNSIFLDNIEAQKVSLNAINVNQGMNDKQLVNIFTRYNLYDKLFR